LNSNIVLSASGLPNGTAAGFTPPTLNGATSATLNLTVSNTVALGNYTITITGSSSIATNSAAAMLSINTNSDSSLVAWLTFDDGTAADSSGNGNHGTLNNGAAIVNDVTRGQVLSLDGVDDYVDLGNAVPLDLSDDGQATIAAWVNMAVTHNHNTIVSKGEWKDAYSLVIKGDTTPANQLWTGNDTSVFSGSAIPLNTWTHAAVTINGDFTTFYINGQVAGTADQDRGNPIDNSLVGVSVGREQYSGSLPAGRWFFNGRIDDVRIYKRALSQTEIQSAMAGLPYPPPVRIKEVGLNGANLTLSGTNGIPGGQFYVLTSTNLTLPLLSWTRVATGQFNLDGTFSFADSLNIGVSQVYYRLQLP
jgi:hypothetical protein